MISKYMYTYIVPFRLSDEKPQTVSEENNPKINNTNFFEKRKRLQCAKLKN